MKHWFIKKAVHFKFSITSRQKADFIISKSSQTYKDLLAKHSKIASKQETVPPMPGVDEDMRNWSFLMILEHNAIVNQRILGTIQYLLEGIPQPDKDTFNVKTDVMPSDNPGEEKAQAFFASVKNYEKYVITHDSLETDRTQNHPIFGTFNAHKWHCMFGFHLQLHLNQAKKLIELCEK